MKNLEEILDFLDMDEYDGTKGYDIFIDEIPGVIIDSIKTEIKDEYLYFSCNKKYWKYEDNGIKIKEVKIPFNRYYKLNNVNNIEKIIIKIDEGLILFQVIRKEPEQKEIKITVE